MRFFIVSFFLVQIVYMNSALACPLITGNAVNNIGDVGEHYPLFLIAKSYHPENIIVVYTKLDTHCRVLPDREHGFMPTLDFYWLMDETSYKPMAAPLKEGVRKRLQFTSASWQQGNTTSFSVRTSDLARVQHDLQSPTVQIKAERQGGACVATASMTLGPSNGHATMKVESVYTKTEALTIFKTMQVVADPESLQLYAVTVKGTDVATGQPIERTYNAAN
jgi:hypothetical protein